MRDCTCIGSCRGAEGLGVGWNCVVDNGSVEDARIGNPSAPIERPRAQELGSRFVSAGPVTIGCMAPDSREALDLAMERWRKHDAAREPKSDDPVYSFAYWLFRWSGIVTGVNLDAPENPWTKV